MKTSLNEDKIYAVTTKADSEVPDVRLQRTLIHQIWMKHYRKIEAYEKENGHCNISFYYEDEVLVRWMAKQRGLQHNGKLQKDREQVLHDIGFVWIKVEDDDEMWGTVSYPSQATTEYMIDSYTVPLEPCDDDISPAMLKCDDDDDAHKLADNEAEHNLPLHYSSHVSSDLLAHHEGNENALEAGAPSAAMFQCDDNGDNDGHQFSSDPAEHSVPWHNSSDVPSGRLAHTEGNEKAFEAGVPLAAMLQCDDQVDNRKHVLAFDVAEHYAQLEKSNRVPYEHLAHNESNLKATGTAPASGLSPNVPPERLPHNKENEKGSRTTSLLIAMEVKTTKPVSAQVRTFLPEMIQHVPRKRPRKGTPYSLSVYRNRS